MESLECGAAALAMVLGWHGKFVPLEELRVACGVSRDGARAASVVAAASRYGLRARAFQLEPERLGELNTPMIVYWAFQHFLVVEGIRHRFGRTQVVVNDPAAGRNVYSWEYFDSGFTGIVISFGKTAAFEPKPGPRRGLGALLRLLAARPVLPTVAGVLAGILLLVPWLTEPALLRAFVDSVLLGRQGVGGAALAMAAAGAAVLGLSWLQGRYLRAAAARHSGDRSQRFLYHLLRLPISFFTQRRASELDRRVAASARVGEFASRQLTVLCSGAVLVLAYFAVLFGYSVALGVLGIGTVTLNIAALHLMARRKANTVRRIRADRGALIATVVSTIRQIEVIKAAGAETEVFRQSAGQHAKVSEREQRLGVPGAILGAIPSLLALLGLSGLLLIGYWQARAGSLTVGTLAASAVLLLRAQQPVARFAGSAEQFTCVQDDLERLRDVERHPRAAGEGTRHDRELVHGHLRLAGVGFGYASLQQPTVDSVTIDVAPGRKVALVGQSGSGKSTVGKLAVRLYEPDSGEITLDGRPLAAIPPSRLADAIGYVAQETVLFPGTIRDNVALWDDTLTESALRRAVRDAGGECLFAGLSDNLDTCIAEDGADLSGGQCQCIALARALARDPVLLVLDEATSALDPDTERRVAANLRRRGCAVLVIAHRLSTVREADEIVVLEAGRAVQRGRHHELIAVPGRYAELVASA